MRLGLGGPWTSLVVEVGFRYQGLCPWELDLTVCGSSFPSDGAWNLTSEALGPSHLFTV